MAGYFKVSTSHVYDGHRYAAEDLTNGLFVTIDQATGKVKKLAAKDANIEMQITEKKEEWGLCFIGCRILKNESSNVFMTEGEWVLDDDLLYDETQYVIKTGKHVKMREPVKSDMCYFSVEKTLYDALNIDDIVNPTAGGTVVKKA